MTAGEYILYKSNGTSFDEKIVQGVANLALGFDASLNPVTISITTVARAAITLSTAGTSGAATWDNSTGILNIPQYAGGSGVATLSGTTVLDFGVEENKIINTISDASITNASLKSAIFVFVETTETSLDDFTLNGVTCSIENIIDNTSFDIRATATNNASGNYTVKYLIII